MLPHPAVIAAGREPLAQATSSNCDRFAGVPSKEECTTTHFCRRLKRLPIASSRAHRRPAGSFCTRWAAAGRLGENIPAARDLGAIAGYCSNAGPSNRGGLDEFWIQEHICHA